MTCAGRNLLHINRQSTWRSLLAMNTYSLDDATLSQRTASSSEMYRSDDLDTARGIVFPTLAGLSFWATVAGWPFVWHALGQLVAALVAE